MGGFSPGNIQWKYLENKGDEDQTIQDSFLTIHVLEPARRESVLDGARTVDHRTVTHQEN